MEEIPPECFIVDKDQIYAKSEEETSNNYVHSSQVTQTDYQHNNSTAKSTQISQQDYLQIKLKNLVGHINNMHAKLKRKRKDISKI